MPRPTSADVARLAGVSRGTVSYAMNGDPDRRLHPATRAKVLSAAAELGYVPSAAARLLRGGAPRSVLMLSALRDGYGSEMSAALQLLSEALAARKIGLVWQLAIEGVPPPIGEITPAAVLVAAVPGDRDFDAVTAGFAVPVLSVFAGRDAHVAGAATRQLQVLADAGASRSTLLIAADPALTWVSALRRAAAARHPGTVIVDVWPPSPPAQERLLVSMLQRGVDGIAAPDEHVGLEVLVAAARCGAVVPQQLQVVAVGAGASHRGDRALLSTVRPPLAAWATAMAEVVASAAGATASEQLELPTVWDLEPGTSTRPRRA